MASHKHDTDYANAEHDHDTDYAAIDHDHDADYAPVSGSANYAAAGHDHNTAYSAIGHNHDADYATIDHDHDADYAPISGSTNYAAASHDNDSHSTKYICRTNLIMQVNPNTTLDTGHYWVKIILNLPVGFAPGTLDWTECISAVCLDPTMATVPQDLHAVSPTVITELEGGIDVAKLKFCLANQSGAEYQKNTGVWNSKLVVVTLSAPMVD